MTTTNITFTTATDDVRATLADDQFVQHTATCDQQSYGDQCIGGCAIVTTTD